MESANVAFDFVDLFAGFEDDDFEMIRAMKGNFDATVQSQKADIHCKRRAKRPDMTLFRVNSSIDEGVGGFPHEVASCSHTPVAPCGGCSQCFPTLPYFACQQTAF
jgi:hypothetical protein